MHSRRMQPWKTRDASWMQQRLRVQRGRWSWARRLQRRMARPLQPLLTRAMALHQARVVPIALRPCLIEMLCAWMKAQASNALCCRCCSHRRCGQAARRDETADSGRRTSLTAVVGQAWLLQTVVRARNHFA